MKDTCYVHETSEAAAFSIASLLIVAEDTVGL